MCVCVRERERKRKSVRDTHTHTQNATRRTENTRVLQPGQADKLKGSKHRIKYAASEIMTACLGMRIRS